MQVVVGWIFTFFMVFSIQLQPKWALISVDLVALMAGVPNVRPNEFDYFHFETTEYGMVAYTIS